jgi:O-succinylbenzoic acid--CoA ligase
MQHALAAMGCGLLPVAGGGDPDEAYALAAAAGAEWRWQPDNGLISTDLPGPGSEPGAVSPSLVVGTSGSSGKPKAVMLTAANLAASAALVNDRLGLGPGDCWLSCLPRTHMGGLMISYRCILAGACLLVHPRFETFAVARDLRRFRVTHLSLVPPLLARLLDAMVEPPPSLRVLLLGGQPLGSGLARRAIEAGWPLHLTYGMTETASGVAISDRLTAVPPRGMVGPPLRGIAVTAGSGPEAPGCLRIRGDVVMAGYANPRRKPGLGLEADWFPTGDLGWVDGEGSLVVSGRGDDLLVIGGEWVLPSLVEAAIENAPGVRAVAVAGLPDAVWGYRLAAAYAGNLDTGDLDAWCRKQLPRRERPRDFLRLAVMPELPSGKPDRRRIADLLTEIVST